MARKPKLEPGPGWCEHCPLRGYCCICGQTHGTPTGPVVMPAFKPKTVVTPLGYEMVARAEKARTLARIFVEDAISSSDVEQIAPAQWKPLHGFLKRAGLLRPHSTVPSAETIERTIAEMRKAEMRKLERRTPGGAVRIPRGPEVA
jgi:hypothetical protein